MSLNESKLSREELEVRLAKLERDNDQLRRAKRRVGLSFHRIPETGSQIEALTEGQFPYLQHIPSLSYTLKDRQAHEAAKDSPLSESTDGNITLIEGDNLPVLAALQQTHRGRVDVIYIDPPYNTGNNDFIYNDARLSSIDDVEGASLDDYEKTLDGKARTVGKDDPERHSLWLSFMERRLFLAKELLSETGVIFVSIDDNEQARLKLLMDEVFGEQNFVADVIWEKTSSTRNDAKYFSTSHEHLLVYKRGIWDRKLLPRTAKANLAYKFNDNDGRGPYAIGDLSARTFSEKGYYAVANPATGIEFYPPVGRAWTVSAEKMSILISENRVHWGSNGKTGPKSKRYLNETQQGLVPGTLWRWSEVGSNIDGDKILKSMFGTREFDYPKPIELIKQIIRLHSKTDAIVLDFFAGSGTTGHAVAELNKEDGGNRQCILVTHGDENGKNIAEDVTAERLKRVLSGENWADKKAHESLPGELNYYKLAFAERQGNPETTVELLQSKFIGYAALQQDVVAVTNQPDPAHFTVLKSTKKTVVMVKDQNYIEDEFDDFNEILETLKNEAEEPKVSTGNHVELVIYVPSSSEFDEYGFEDMGWKYIPFPLEYLKSHAKLINRMKANGTLLPILTGSEDAAIIDPTVETENIEYGETN